jgi:hypothetical protein
MRRRLRHDLTPSGSAPFRPLPWLPM